MMSNDQNISSCFHLRGIEYIISMLHGEGVSNNFTIEVLNNGTLDVWCGTFDAEYIENLTHKTGNFKQFSIFSNMLKTALLKQSESVTLDLLTYADLEQLRLQRAGNRASVEKQTPANLNSKRYLILTYTVEFDRIHYPLPLHQKAATNNTSLQQIIVNLRSEVKQLKDKLKYKPKDLETTNDHTREPLCHDEELGVHWENYQHEKASGTKKENSLMKGIIKKLEIDSLKDKTQHQRVLRKKNQEICELQQELLQLRSSERQLKIRVKSLTNELAIYKRNRSTSARTLRYEQSSSCESLNCMGLRNRSTSRERSSSFERRPLHRKQTESRERKSSRERSYSHNHDNNLNTSRNSGNSHGSHKTYRSRTPSPSFRRFDPTAYIKEQERKKEEVQRRNNWRQKSAKGNGNSQHKSYHFHRKGNRSGDSSDAGLSDCSSSYYRIRHRPSDKYVHAASPKENSRDFIPSGKEKYSHSAKHHSRKNKRMDKIEHSVAMSGINILERSLDIGDIDAKLEKLQQQLYKSSIS
ncbi:coiled-coil domain-containing protein 61-like isoform X1 [Argonauta hians]